MSVKIEDYVGQFYAHKISKFRINKWNR